MIEEREGSVGNISLVSSLPCIATSLGVYQTVGFL